VILNRQKKVSLNLGAMREFARRLRRALSRNADFNVCFVDDAAIARLNAAYRRKLRPTDVLSFPWKAAGGRAEPREFHGFLGDIVISAETARRNARVEGHSTRREVEWLILHGALHLVGYDHETDEGQMTARELALRRRLGIDGGSGRARPR
jgi:probable rRNA maturation factor